MKLLPLALGAAVAGVATNALADDAPVEVTRSRLPTRIMLDVQVAGGVRQIGGMDAESTTGLELVAKLGRRIKPSYGVVAILEAEPMAREDYISYGAWTFGMGVRWDGPVIVTAGLGLVVGSAKQLLPDYSLASYSYTGVGALVHGVLPVARVGHSRIGLAGNLEAKTLGPNTVTGLSVGAAVIW